MFRPREHTILSHCGLHSAMGLTGESGQLLERINLGQSKLFHGISATSQKAQHAEIMGYRTRAA